jgi:Ca2+-binding EF-hand superfamily protein
LLASFNRNADYSIDQSEFSAGRDASFKIADNDGSGSLNMFEIEHWRLNALGSADASPGSMFFDTDFNNIITHLEFDTGLGKLYQSSDKDGDGIIRFSELVRVTARSQGGGETREQRPSGERGRGGGGGRKQRG